MVWGVNQEGFYGTEVHGGELRWTNGAAQLIVPLNQERLPQFLQVEIALTGPKGAKLQVLVNDCELFQEWIPTGKWSHVFSLRGCQLGDRAVIKLLSDTFVPKESIPGSQDTRTLGVRAGQLQLVGAPW